MIDKARSNTSCVVAARRLLGAAAVMLFPRVASASFFSGDALDTVADVMAIFVLCVVPLGAIYLFWMVHILPEKVAEKTHHPQKHAIKTLCLLSLVFGGLLWPIAWLWAYTKPVGYKLAYGTDKHEDYYTELAEKDAADARILKDDIDKLQNELEALEQRGALPEELEIIRDQLAALQTRIVAPPPMREAK